MGKRLSPWAAALWLCPPDSGGRRGWSLCWSSAGPLAISGLPSLCPSALWAPALPLPAPMGVRIWKDVISGALRDACLGLTLIIPS